MQAVVRSPEATGLGCPGEDGEEGKMALMEITVVPLGAGTSLSKYVAKAILALESVPEVDYELTSMGP